MKILFHLPLSMIEHCFVPADLQRLSEQHEVLLPTTADDLASRFLQEVPVVQAVVTGWGTPPLTSEMLDAAPDLQLIVHAAGSIKSLVPADLWERGVRVSSCNGALAVGVAETTLGMIICGLKGLFPARDWARAGGWHDPKLGTEKVRVQEPFRKTIGIVSASKVGRHLIGLLRGFEMEILVTDPYLSDTDAAQIGVQRVSLQELCESSHVVTLHAPLLPATLGMMGAEQFAAMRDDAIFINTARGALVDEAALIAELERGRLFAFIDVTDPEPPRADHPFRRLDNVVLTPHLAGHAANGARRQGREAVEHLLDFARGLPLSGEVTPAMFAQMA